MDEQHSYEYWYEIPVGRCSRHSTRSRYVESYGTRSRYSKLELSTVTDEQTMTSPENYKLYSARHHADNYQY
eukprot:scaffold578364_cov19-Prasinocladus_malaysianus.AAC.2